MLLREVLYKVAIRSVAGSTEEVISGVQLDSRKVTPANLFIAIKGTAADGHQFIEKAIEKGATAIVCEEMPVDQASGVVYVQVQEGAAAAARIAQNFYENPSAKLKLVGVTCSNPFFSFLIVASTFSKASGVCA